MVRKPSLKDSAQPRAPETPLQELLSVPELLELANLVTSISDIIGQSINDGFDLSFKTTDTPPPLLGLEDLERRNPNLAAEYTGASDVGSSEARHPDATKGLKQDAIENFQSWRDDLISQIIHAATSKSDDHLPPQDHQDQKEADEMTKAERLLSTPVLINLYPATKTALTSLTVQKKSELLTAFLLLLLGKGYSSYSRVLMLHLCSSLELPMQLLISAETTLAKGLVEAAKQLSAAEETKAREASSAVSRRWKVGLAGVAGAALIGVTGGLAAPLVAAGIGTIMGGIGLGGTLAAGLLGAISSSGIIVGTLFGAYGYGMTSSMMETYAKEVSDFAFIPLRNGRKTRTVQGGVQDIQPEDRRLRVTIPISGWLTQRRDVLTPWRVLGSGTEVFPLRWELEALLALGKSLDSFVSSAVWTVASTEIIAHTAFASLMFALWPIGILKVSKLLDNPFMTAKNRADKAGLVLADALVNGCQGERPVTLIGYSMGARVIYSCLTSLAERRAFGIVESAVLIGAPAPSDSADWRAIRSVVAGRLVNVYAEKDYILAFLYRSSSIQLGVAGLQAVRDIKGVENVDVSDIVTGHLRYQHLIGTVLEKIEWEDIDASEVRKEEEYNATLDEEEKKTKQRNAEVRRKSEPNSEPALDTDLISFGDDEAAPSQATQASLPRNAPSTASLDLLDGFSVTTDVATAQERERMELKAVPARVVQKKKRGSALQDRLPNPTSSKSGQDLLDMLTDVSIDEAKQGSGSQGATSLGQKKLQISSLDRSQDLSYVQESQENRKNRKSQSSIKMEGEYEVSQPAKSNTAEREQSIQAQASKQTPIASKQIGQRPIPSRKVHNESSDDEGGIIMNDNDDSMEVLEPAPLPDGFDPWANYNR